MKYNDKTKFRIRVDKLDEHFWSFGVHFSHMWEETYLHINFYKWCISIGFLCDEYD